MTVVILPAFDDIMYWKREDGKSMLETLSSPPVNVPYQREPQGEAIAWNTDDSGFYTLSEEPDSKEAEIYYYKRK